MSALTAFEVQSFRKGNWKIETITDSKEMAVHQAEQVIMNPAVSKVRVVQEAYDEESGDQKFRIVFVRNKVVRRPPADPNTPETRDNAEPPPGGDRRARARRNGDGGTKRQHRGPVAEVRRDRLRRHRRDHRATVHRH